ncbi:hypothetical protein H180DRAFT_01066 [Streptomyces sp. WMMB 322]|nr:hypothetical protein H180DRAFT_01066 [Streptomyces sp. WMMB 322]
MALAAGAAVGLALGGLGGGGSVLAVPALIYLLDFSPVAATTASLLIVTATSLTGLLTHARAGNVRWKAGAAFAAAGLVPAALAGAAAARLPHNVLTVAFAVIAAIAAAGMLRTKASTEDGEQETPARPVRAVSAGAGLGGLTGLLGVGGGFLAVPALVGALGFRMRAAIGTSLLVIGVNSLAALSTRFATVDGLDWTVVAPFTGAAVLGAWDGKRLAARLSGAALQRSFAVVLLAVAAFMFADTLI